VKRVFHFEHPWNVLIVFSFNHKNPPVVNRKKVII